MQEVPTYKLVTPAVLSDRMKIRGSLAREAIKHLEKEGLIKPVAKHASLVIYTRATEKAE